MCIIFSIVYQVHVTSARPAHNYKCILYDIMGQHLQNACLLRLCDLSRFSLGHRCVSLVMCHHPPCYSQSIMLIASNQHPLSLRYDDTSLYAWLHPTRTNESWSSATYESVMSQHVFRKTACVLFHFHTKIHTWIHRHNMSKNQNYWSGSHSNRSMTRCQSFWFYP